MGSDDESHFNVFLNYQGAQSQGRESNRQRPLQVTCRPHRWAKPVQRLRVGARYNLKELASSNNALVPGAAE